MAKIINFSQLEKIIKSIKIQKKTIIQCHGVFDLLHIGHIKHFKEAKKFADVLIVTATSDKFVKKGPGKPVFNSNLRVEALASVEEIDYVILNDSETSTKIIKKIKPNIYFKGPDYKDLKKDITGKIKEEKLAVKSVGGILKFSKDIIFSSSEILNSHTGIFSDNQKNYLKSIKKKYLFEKIKNDINFLNNKKILIIGEAIIDEYVFCEALGKSGKESVLVLRELKTEKYLGGVLSIARNISEFSNKTTLISFLGEKKEYEKYISKNLNNKIDLNFLYKKNSPTILKKIH